MKKSKNYFKRGMVYLMALCLMVGIASNLPMNVLEVYAATQAPSSASYLTKIQLETGYNLETAGQQVGKLTFGKNDGGAVQEWYILGKDSGVNGGNDNTVLFADKSITTTYEAFDSSYIPKDWTYPADIGYGASEGMATVYPNHYGASQLRGKLNNEIYNACFSSAEQNMMNATTFVTTDIRNSLDYSLKDKVYALSAMGINEEFCHAGSDNGKKIHYSYWIDRAFFLRTGYSSDMQYVLYADGYSRVTYYESATNSLGVQPAININLANVLFASSAKADGTSGTLNLDNAMTLRLDGSSTVASKAYNSADQIIIYPKSGETIGVVIQGNDGANDWYYSKSINQAEPVRVLATDIVASGVIANTPDLTQCEVWIEKTVDGLAYSVESTALTEITSVEVTAVDAPVTGSNLDVSAVCATTGVNSTQVKWSPDHTQATAQTDYSANVTITPTEGYGFAITCTAMLNGENITPSYNADGSMALTKVFPTTGSMVVPPPPVNPPSNNNNNNISQDEWDEVPKTGDNRETECLLVIAFVAGIGSLLLKRKNK